MTIGTLTNASPGGPFATLLHWRPVPLHTPGAAADGTRMDTVELLVGDLDGQTAFYRDAVTLDVLEQSGARVTLGRDGIPIVTLTHTPDLPPVDRYAAGLYHTAIAFPDRAALAAAVLSMAQRAADLYQGATDHTFSNAFYFSDPEGNGIELYWDRPVEVWQNQPAGWMPTNTAIDPNTFLRAHLDPARVDSRRRHRGPRAPAGRRHRRRPPVLRRHAGLRCRHGPRVGSVHLRRRLPPPHRAEHLAQCRGRSARGLTRPRRHARADAGAGRHPLAR